MYDVLYVVNPASVSCGNRIRELLSTEKPAAAEQGKTAAGKGEW